MPPCLCGSNDLKLKEYQERTLKEVKAFLEQLAVWHPKARDGEDLGGGTPKFDFAYAAGHLLNVALNPWVGYDFVEREVTSFLDEQSHLYFCYRNIPHRGYYVIRRI